MQRERFSIKAAGQRLAVERLRPDRAVSEPVIVFLHEGLGSIAMWRDFPERLCARLRLQGVVYDRRGHGRSEPLDRPRTPDYLHDEARVTLPEVLSGLGIERPILFGHSDGGSIALLYAAAFPEAVAAIVCEAAHVFVEAETLAGIRSAVKAYRTTRLRERLARHHGEKTDRLFEAWATCWLSPAFASWNIEAELPRIICPTLILQGEDDEYGTPAQVAAIMCGVRGPAESTLLPGCAHIPHLQAQDAVMPLAERFIARHVTGQSLP